MATNFARKKRYSITAMFDDKGNPLEYYFDINIKNITQKGTREH